MPESPSPKATQFLTQISDFAGKPQVDNLMAVSAAIMLLHRELGHLDEVVDPRLLAQALPPDFAETYQLTMLAAFGRGGGFDVGKLLLALQGLNTPLEAAAFVALLLHDAKPAHRGEIMKEIAEAVAARIAARGKAKGSV